jgi:Putative beta-barrel porin-2, OmpL-like. bbp2
MNFKPFASVAALCLAGVLGVPGAASAQTMGQAPAPAPTPAPAPAAAPSTTIDLGYGFSMTGHLEVGTSINFDSPANDVNFGQVFTDQANTFRMNQALINIERDLDPKNTGYQWGFKFTGMYGTDARATHFFNELDRVTNSPYQWDIVELDVLAHIPTIGGGTDLRIGQYPTPIGYEVIDTTVNPFYSHSYIFFYGLPFKHTGILSNTHINDTLDLWFGIDTGVNDSLGAYGVVNNELPKGIIGFGLNGLMGGNLTILALSHIGPEASAYAQFGDGMNGQLGGPTCNAFTAGCGAAFVPAANNRLREYFDVVTTYKINDAWTTVNEINVVHDDLAAKTVGGVAQYLSYSLNDQWTLNARAEIFADQGGFAVCTAQSSLDYDNPLRGLQPASGYCSGNGPSGAFNSAVDTTYGEITLGASYKPPLLNQAYVTIRPELRYDTVVGGSKHSSPYDVNGAGFGTKTSQWTLAVDAIIGF